MGIYVACSCGQAFSARPDLAGQTLACPACGRPIAVPLEASPAVIHPLPAGSYVMPSPTVIRQPAFSASPALLGAPLAKPADGEVSERVPPIVLYASIAAGSVLVVLLGVIAAQQILSRLPNTSPQESQSAPPLVASAPAGANPPQPTIVFPSNPSARASANRESAGSAASSPTEPAATQPSQPTAKPGSRAGWTRIELPGSIGFVEFPTDAPFSQVKRENGVTMESVLYGNPDATYLVTRYSGGKYERASDTFNALDQRAPGTTSRLGARKISVQGYDAMEIAHTHPGGYMRHQFIVTSDTEMIAIQATARSPGGHADADYFVNSLRINQTASLQSLLPKLRWPNFTGESSGN